MRRFLLTTLTIYAFMATPLQAQDATPRTITMSGYGSSWGIPDQATLNFSINTTRPDPTDSMSANSEIMKRLIDKLKASGIAENDLETSGFSISPAYKQTEEGRTLFDQVVGYQVKNGLNATIQNADRVGEIIQLTASDKDVQLDSVSFNLSSFKEQHVIARGKALEDARKKAEQIAALSNSELGDIVKVSEGADREESRGKAQYSAQMPAPTLQLERGIEWISEQITVTWQIKSKGQ